jgi:hypothetical protein
MIEPALGLGVLKMSAGMGYDRHLQLPAHLVERARFRRRRLSKRAGNKTRDGRINFI